MLEIATFTAHSLKRIKEIHKFATIHGADIIEVGGSADNSEWYITVGVLPEIVSVIQNYIDGITLN